MSNLVLNYNFSTPVIPTNSVYYTANSTSTQLISLVCVCASTYVSLQNGSTVFNYPPLPPRRNGQFISLQYVSLIQQSINIISTGFYTLTLSYALRPGYQPNAMLIYFNGVLMDTIDPSKANFKNWNTVYTNTFYTSTTGNQVLLFHGSDVAMIEISQLRIFRNVL